MSIRAHHPSQQAKHPCHIGRHRFANTLFACLIATSFLYPNISQAQDLRASVALIPSLAESPNKGAFIDLINAIDEVYEDGDIHIDVYPFARSIHNVVTGEADFHIPMIRTDYFARQNQEFRFMRKPMGKVCLVIYSHRRKPLTHDDLYNAISSSPYPYLLSVTRGSAQFLDLEVQEDSHISHALRKVAQGRLDAFIGAQEEADLMLKELEFTGLHRECFACFDDVIIIPNNLKGDKTEKILEQALIRLEQSGRLKELHSKIHLPYQDWQPYDRDIIEIRHK